MVGLFGTNAPLQVDINLIMHLAMFLIIGVGLIFKYKRKFKIHGSMMGIAVILHVISFVTVMGPSFSGGYEFLTTSTSEPGVQTIWIHAIPGAIAMLLGIFLVGAWSVRPSNVAACSRRKRIMDVTITLWLLSLIFGIVSYTLFYL